MEGVFNEGDLLEQGVFNEGRSDIVHIAIFLYKPKFSRNVWF